MDRKTIEKQADAHMATIAVGFDRRPIADKATMPEAGEQLIQGQGVLHHQHDVYVSDIVVQVDGECMDDGKPAVTGGPVGLVAGDGDDFTVSRAQFGGDEEAFLDSQLHRLVAMGLSKTRTNPSEFALFTANVQGVTDFIWTDERNLKNAKVGDLIFADFPRSEAERTTRQTGVGSVKVPWVGRVGSGRVTANRILSSMTLIDRTVFATTAGTQVWDPKWVDNQGPNISKAAGEVLKNVVELISFFAGPQTVASLSTFFAAVPNPAGAAYSVREVLAQLISSVFDAVYEDQARLLGKLQTKPHALGDRVLIKLI